MLGFSKWFVVFLFLSAAVWYGTGNWMVASQIMIGFIVIKVVWKFFTNER